MLFILYSCGVKAPPVKYPETAIDSYVDSFTNSSLKNDEESKPKTTDQSSKAPEENK